MARPSSATASVLVLVALAGAADLASAAAGVRVAGAVAFARFDDHKAAAASLQSSSSPAVAGGSDDPLSGMMQCLLGCFTQVFGCALGCMGKGPDLPLCIISCDQKSIVCMVRCGLAPSPPKPAPPGPKPPAPKPPAPQPPAPKPPAPGPPYDVAGRRAPH